ncbi:hypothetical protein KR084_012851, partial [Drosophila pseudotakahashii]
STCHVTFADAEAGEAAVVRVMNYTLAEGHDDEVPVIRRLKECPTVRLSVRLSVCPSVRSSV